MFSDACRRNFYVIGGGEAIISGGGGVQWRGLSKYH
jgi:hypothetical protein